jgi:hypothetical protein
MVIVLINVIIMLFIRYYNVMINNNIMLFSILETSNIHLKSNVFVIYYHSVA